MRILVVSANQLFGEVIVKTLSDYQDAEVEIIEPAAAPVRIDECHHDVIIIDENLKPHVLECIFGFVRKYPKSRLILLDSISNNIVVLDSFKSMIKEVKDLAEAIGI